jgi:hypothetical protein
MKPQPSPSGGEPSVRPSLAPPASIAQRVPLSDVFALEPTVNGVWYLRGEEGRARVGRADVNGSLLETDAGVAPVAIAATPNAVFVLEGSPTLAGSEARTNVLERLDPATLQVVASTQVEGLGTDLVVADGRAWVATTNGKVSVFDAANLVKEGETQLEGKGPSSLAWSAGFVWVLNDRIGGDGSTELLLHRVDSAMTSTSVAMTKSVAMTNAGLPGVLMTGTRVWVGAGAPNSAGAEGALYPFGFDLSPEAAVLVRRPVALAEGDDWLWSVTSAGELGALNVQTRASRATTSVGETAVDIVISGGHLWVASADLVVLDPDPK